MEREIVRVVAVVRAAICVVERRPANGDDVVRLELPIDILKAVLLLVRVMEQNATRRPVLQIF